ncbi:hypothetical protein J6590_002872 [Homalodisca vitripennis]|nr:hypothetical protein J6590_002872 [Homalodisca vitripennis]
MKLLINEATHLCFDTPHGELNPDYNVGIYTCDGTIIGGQLFSLSNDGQIRRNELCASIISSNVIKMKKCSPLSKTQIWRLTKNGHLRNDAMELCLDAEALGVGDTLKASKCNNSPTQIWSWDYYSPQNGHLRNDAMELCLDAEALGVGDTLKASKCNNSPTQIWSWDYYSPQQINNI